MDSFTQRHLHPVQSVGSIWIRSGSTQTWKERKTQWKKCIETEALTATISCHNNVTSKKSLYPFRQRHITTPYWLQSINVNLQTVFGKRKNFISQKGHRRNNSTEISIFQHIVNNSSFQSNNHSKIFWWSSSSSPLTLCLPLGSFVMWEAFFSSCLHFGRGAMIKFTQSKQYFERW